MSVRREPNGKWSCSFYYNEWNGERVRHRKFGFRTKKEAQSYEHDFISNHSGSPKMTLNALTELYLEDCKHRVRATTLRTKSNLIRKHITPYFGETPIADITPAMIRRWQNEKISAGAAPTFQRSMGAQLSAMLNFAMRYYGLSENVVVKCGHMGKSNREGFDIWTVEEFTAFRNSIADKPMLLAMFSILFWTGMRSGEMLALTWGDLDFDSNTAHISKTLARVEGKVVFNPPKTPKSRRTVTVPPSVMGDIKAYRDTLYEWSSTDRAFPGSSHRLYYALEKGCEASGVSKIRIHDLRHSHASLLVEMGCSPVLIAERLGHDNIETTLRTYSHLYPNKQTEVALELDNLINY